MTIATNRSIALQKQGTFPRSDANERTKCHTHDAFALIAVKIFAVIWGSLFVLLTHT